jgi:hypothetical protein
MNATKKELLSEKEQGILMHNFFVQHTTELGLPSNAWYKFVEAVRNEKKRLADKKEANKAANKRARQSKESIEIRLGMNLREFKNDYLERYSNYKIERLEAELQNLKDRLDSGNFDCPERSMLHVIKRSEEQLLRRSTLLLQFLTEAEETYSRRFESLVEKVFHHDLNVRKMNVERVSSGNWNDFSFLISDDVTELHARFIYAAEDSVLVVPHFRFIITKRNK